MTTGGPLILFAATSGVTRVFNCAKKTASGMTPHPAFQLNTTADTIGEAQCPDRCHDTVQRRGEVEADIRLNLCRRAKPINGHVRRLCRIRRDRGGKFDGKCRGCDVGNRLHRREIDDNRP